MYDEAHVTANARWQVEGVSFGADRLASLFQNVFDPDQGVPAK